MASWAVLGVPTAACGAGAVTMMSAKGGGGEPKKGLLDWLTGALDKPSFSETDPVLQRAEDAPPKKPTSSSSSKSKQSSSSSSSSGGGGGGGLFGLFGKK